MTDYILPPFHLIIIAIMRRLATTDTLLVALSCAVVVLSLWPQGQRRQEFQVTAANGEVRKYSLALDDPRLRELQVQFGETGRYLPPARLAIARWTRDLADFYCQHTAEIKPSAEQRPDQPVAVRTVAHQAPVVGWIDQAERSPKSAASVPGISEPASRAHWITVRKQAEQAIAIAQHQQSLPPPVVMGAVLEDQRSGVAFLFAIVAGCSLAGGYTFWRRRCPTVELATAQDSSSNLRMMFSSDVGEDATNSASAERCRQIGLPGGDTALLANAENEFSIPSRWVRVRQPFAVVVRRASFAALVFCALLLIAC